MKMDILFVLTIKAPVFKVVLRFPGQLLAGPGKPGHL